MIVFWFIAAALAAVALLLVLRPLVRRRESQRVSRSEANVSIYKDQLRELDAELAAGTLSADDHGRARLELEARLLEDVPSAEVERAPARSRAAAVAVGVAVPLLALGIYFIAGTPGALDPRQAVPSADQVEAMVARLAAKLRENPDDADGWKLLGRSYTVMGRYAQAVEAYAKAAERSPRDAQLLADLADVLAMARGQSLQGEPEQLALRALEIEPGNLKALALAGSAAFERKDFAAAAKHWERMLAYVEPNTEDARAIQQNVAEARSLANEKPSTSPKPPSPSGLRGTVSLEPNLKDQVSPEDTVFVFARAAEGPPMPLAVARVRVRDLPYRFALDDSMAMSPALKLSAFPKVVVTARVSKSGGAVAQPGDLQGASGPVANDAAAVRVVIDAPVR